MFNILTSFKISLFPGALFQGLLNNCPLRWCLVLHRIRAVLDSLNEVHAVRGQCLYSEEWSYIEATAFLHGHRPPPCQSLCWSGKPRPRTQREVAAWCRNHRFRLNSLLSENSVLVVENQATGIFTSHQMMNNKIGRDDPGLLAYSHEHWKKKNSQTMLISLRLKSVEKQEIC